MPRELRKKDWVGINYRMQRHVWERVRAEAERSHVSVNSELNTRIEQSLDQTQQKGLVERMELLAMKIEIMLPAINALVATNSALLSKDKQ